MLHQQEPLARVVRFCKVFQIIPGVFLFLAGGELPQGRRQAGAEQRFCHKRIHARRSGFFLDLAELEGGQDDDRDVLPDAFPNPSGRCDAVHLRHLPVQDHRKIVAAGLVPRRAAFHGSFAGQDPFACDADLPQGIDGAFAAFLDNS